KEIDRYLRGAAKIFEKDFFDLTKEKKISDYIACLNKKQVIVAGCETDVCVLQSCLGLLDLGYDVYVTEELVFSSSRNVDAAIARMKAEGAVFLTYKSLYYELIEAAEGGRHRENVVATFGPCPHDLPDTAVQWPFDARDWLKRARLAGCAAPLPAGLASQPCAPGRALAQAKTAYMMASGSRRPHAPVAT